MLPAVPPSLLAPLRDGGPAEPAQKPDDSLACPSASNFFGSWRAMTSASQIRPRGLVRPSRRIHRRDSKYWTTPGTAESWRRSMICCPPCSAARSEQRHQGQRIDQEGVPAECEPLGVDALCSILRGCGHLPPECFYSRRELADLAHRAVALSAARRVVTSTRA